MENIKEFKEFSNKIVLVTNLTDLYSAQEEKLISNGIVLIDKQEAEALRLNRYKPNNIFNQFKSIQLGVDYFLGTFKSGYVIKIRTDVTLDYKSLFEDIQKIFIYNDKFLLITSFRNRKKASYINSKLGQIVKNVSKYEFFMEDFVFVCEIELLNISLKNSSRIKTLSSHQYLLNGLIDIYFNSLNLKTIFYLIERFRGRNSMIASIIYWTYSILVIFNEKLFEKLTYKIIYPMSHKTVKSIQWRESSYNDWEENKNKNNYEFLLENNHVIN
jgi:hypothetical protein